jgi:hypothetical protein
VRTVLRAVGSTIVLLVIYYLLPLDNAATWLAITLLVIGLAAFVGLVAFHARAIMLGVSTSRADSLSGVADGVAATGDHGTTDTCPVLRTARSSIGTGQRAIRTSARPS